MKEKFRAGQKLYMRHEEKLMLGYREKASQKRPVILLATKTCANSVEKQTNKRNMPVQIKTKPEMIDLYNTFMGGVDYSDQMLYVYQDERRTVKY